MTAAVDVFYTPHADDEVLGMGGAIAEASLAGHRVVLVLVTDNRPSARATNMFTDRLRCAWHRSEKHDFGQFDLIAARFLELTECAAVLGVHEIAALGIPEQLGLDDYPRFVEAIRVTLHRYAIMYPGATHHVVAGGTSDFHAETNRGNLSHQALYDAAMSMPELGAVEVHRVYVYSLPAVQRIAPVIRRLTENVMAIKRRALDAYRVYAPERGRIAYGYHSVPELFDGAAADPREYLELGGR